MFEKFLKGYIKGHLFMEELFSKNSNLKSKEIGKRINKGSKKKEKEISLNLCPSCKSIFLEGNGVCASCSKRNSLNA